MSVSIDNPSYDKVYQIYAWRDNNVRLVLTQGEGATTLDDSESDISVSRIKAPKFQLKDERGNIDLSGCNVSLALTRPNGSSDLLECIIDNAPSGTISCPITTSATEFHGHATGEIVVRTENGILKFYGIYANIYKGTSDDAAAQSTQFSALTSALRKVLALDEYGYATMDDIIVENGTNPVASGVIYEALESKEDSGNKVAEINISDIDSTTKYPSNNAVVDYLEDNYLKAHEVYTRNQIDEELESIDEQLDSKVNQNDFSDLNGAKGYDLLRNSTWVSGSICYNHPDYADGHEVSSNTTIRSNYIEIPEIATSINISCNSGWAYLYLIYDSNKAVIGGATFSTSTRKINLTSFTDASYIRIAFQKSPQSTDITINDYKANLQVLAVTPIIENFENSDSKIRLVSKSDILVYFAGGNLPTITNGSNGVITVALANDSNGKNLIIYDGVSEKPFTASDILTKATGAPAALGLSVDNESRTFSGNLFKLVYNYQNRDISFKTPYSAVGEYEVELLTRMYTSHIGGIIYDMVADMKTNDSVEKLLDDNSKIVVDVNNKINNIYSLQPLGKITWSKSGTNIRTDYIELLPSISKIAFSCVGSNIWKYYVIVYNSDKTTVATTINWTTSSSTLNLETLRESNPDVKYIRIYFGKHNDASYDIDVENDYLNLNIQVYTKLTEKIESTKDIISGLNTKINDLYSLQPLGEVIWEHNAVNTTTGKDTSTNNTTIRTNYIELLPSISKITLSCKSGWAYYAVLINSDKTSAVNSPSWTTANSTLNLKSMLENGVDVKYIRLVIGKTNQNGIGIDNTYTMDVENDCLNLIIQVSTVLTDKLEKIDSKVFANIPDYFSSQLATVEKNVKKDLLAARGNGDNFAFITDVHWEGNYKHSPVLLKKLAQDKLINLIICGGDLIDGNMTAVSNDKIEEEKLKKMNLINSCVNAFCDAGVPFITAVGNHDFNSGHSADYKFSDEEYFSSAQYQSVFENIVYGDNWYFYYDKPLTKTRYIVLDSGVNNSKGDICLYWEQFTWLKSVLATTPEDYHVIIVIHSLGQYRFLDKAVDSNNPFNYMNIKKKNEQEEYKDVYVYEDEQGKYVYLIRKVNENGEEETDEHGNYKYKEVDKDIEYVDENDKVKNGTIENALDTLFKIHRIEAVFFGHTHYDANFTTKGGIPVISTDTDSRWQNYGIPRPSDYTVESQCFDIVTMDYNNRKIYMRRVGRGSDRTIGLPPIVQQNTPAQQNSPQNESENENTTGG